MQTRYFDLRDTKGQQKEIEDKIGAAAKILRAGKLVTPGGAVEICHILGKDETLRRLRLGLDKLRA